MSLAKIMQKPKLVVLGLNSGTSADGLDMAALAIHRQKKIVKIKFLAGKHAAYPSLLRQSILKLADSGTTSLESFIYANNAVGEFFGQKAAAFVSDLSRRKISVDLISSHGQTVRHIPESKSSSKMERGTLQIGSLEMISTLSQKVTVGDFRQADVALGNEGAPITVAAMQKLFGSNRESRLIVNIGGISNYFYFPLKKEGLISMAADCGPGNSLCDILSEKLFHTKFDKNGKIAQSGKPSRRIQTLLLAEPFFKGKTVSTGRETFGKAFVEKIILLGKKFKLSKADIMSTAAELTVLAIAHKVKPLIKKDTSLSKLYLTGGGRKNKFFEKRLQELLPQVKIQNADKLGFDSDFIEAAAYAVMGVAALRSESSQTRFGTKKRRSMQPVLGKIVQPPRSL